MLIVMFGGGKYAGPPAMTYDKRSHYDVPLATLYDTRSTQPRLNGKRDPFMKVNESPISEEVFDLARRWILDCLLNHGSCSEDDKQQSNGRGNLAPPLPLRVIDVGTVTGPEEPRLIIPMEDVLNVAEYTEEDPFVSRYVTLSYCWGPSGENSAITTKSNLKQRLQNIPVEILPKTLKDAVVITRKLGVRYLWVDALCIIQPTESDSKDWQQQSAVMGDIYRNSLCTIAASGATHGQAGCFLERIGSKYPVFPCQVTDTENTDHKRPPLFINPGMPNWMHAVTQAPLNARGWVLQELTLSSRILHWTKDVLYWQCSALKASEYRPYGLLEEDIDTLGVYPMIGGKIKAFTQQQLAAGAWVRLVHRYSRLGLTNITDKLPALSGMAKQIQKYAHDDYLAGLWRSELLRGLAWQAIIQLDQPRQAAPPYLAPSWSWASVDAPVIFYSPSLRGLGEWVAEIIEAEVTPAGPDPLGQVSSGRIRIAGLLELIYLQDNLTPEDLHGYRSVFDYPCFDRVPVVSPQVSMRYLSCLQLCTSKNEKVIHGALILKPTGRAQHEYYRIGWIELTGNHYFACVERSIIDII